MSLSFGGQKRSVQQKCAFFHGGSKPANQLSKGQVGKRSGQDEDKGEKTDGEANEQNQA